MKRYLVWSVGYMAGFWAVMVAAAVVGLDTDTDTGGWRAWVVLGMGIYIGCKAGSDLEWMWKRKKLHVGDLVKVKAGTRYSEFAPLDGSVKLRAEEYPKLAEQCDVRDGWIVLPKAEKLAEGKKEFLVKIGKRSVK